MWREWQTKKLVRNQTKKFSRGRTNRWRIAMNTFKMSDMLHMAEDRLIILGRHITRTQRLVNEVEITMVELRVFYQKICHSTCRCKKSDLELEMPDRTRT